MSPPKSLYLAFVTSGVAGLVYEVLWTRYLGLYVGHGAYAQVLVLSVYLGGMALGAMVVAGNSHAIRRPLHWYAGCEGVLALFGLVFHPVFLAASNFSYDVLFPAMGSAQLVGSARWAIAGLLILPQAIVLGATFPLMAATIVRTDVGHPGRGVALVYLLNTLGGAAGVLLAGFWLIGALGLPGTSAAAALLNLLAAGIAFAVSRHQQVRRSDPSGFGPESGHEGPETDPQMAGAGSPPLQGLTRLMLTVSFGTALASFAYEISWIRLLSLALGSATHSFEIMLSAFILGIALGAWWIRGRTDDLKRPIYTLGAIQVLMGLTAVVSIPLFYLVSFDAVVWLVQNLPGRNGGYALFNLSRYALSLLVMLPSTLLAGMTLPIITGTLMRARAGEQAIGRVYGINTVGSVAGAAIAGLIALPWLGLKGLVLAGAALDIGLGLWLLQRSVRWEGSSLRAVAIAGVASVACIGTIGFGLRMDQIILTSGAYRAGVLAREGEQVSLYYGDGRTATVSASIGTGDGVIGLATNGKPDASISPRWLSEGRDTLPDRPIEAGGDYTTQVLAPAVAMAFNPGARTVANIGHGSGMSATTFLTSEQVERVVTIEIEPLMLEGSLVFLPANGPAISDPRSTYVFDDAKSFFSYQRERFDIIFAEPSNPWVSGTASLFTAEFYRRVSSFLAEGGVLAQWIQIYELNDELLLTVIAALDRVFPSYRAYLVGDFDVAIVATVDGSLEEADWSVLESERFLQMTQGAPRFRREHMESLVLFDETTLRPLLDGGIRPNSDFHPILDLGAERTRFEGSIARGTYGLGTSRVDLHRLLAEELRPPAPYWPVPAYGLAPMVSDGRAAWLRDVEAVGGGISPEEFPEWQSGLVQLQSFLAASRGSEATLPWEQWTVGFGAVESDLHKGTVGWVDERFYDVVFAFMDEADAPPQARARVELRHALSLMDWERAATAADLLVSRAQAGEGWEDPSTLLDIAVLAYLNTGRVTAARNTYAGLAGRTGRAPGHLRNRLLDALIGQAELAGGSIR